MSVEKENLILTIFGMKGSGKSTLVKKILPEFPRVIVLDTNQEYERDVAVIFSDLLEAVDFLKGYAENDDPFSMAYVPDELPEDGITFLRMAATVPRSLVVVDEAHMYCSASVMPYPVQRLVRLGRHSEISQVYVAQRPAALPRDLTAQSDLVVSFRQHEGRDVAYMTGLFGRSAESLKTLSDYRVEVYGDTRKAPQAVLDARAKKAVDAQGNLF